MKNCKKMAGLGFDSILNNFLSFLNILILHIF